MEAFNPKSFFFLSVWKLTYLLKICLTFCSVFPSCNFDIFSRNVSELLSEVYGFSASSFLEMSKIAFGHLTHHDIQNVDLLQILPCNIIGSWDLRKRIMTFDLENFETIDVLYRSFY